MKEKILIVGAYHEMIELCEDCGFEIAGIIDNDYTDEYYGVKIVGTDNDAARLYDKFKDCLAVITPFMPHVRERLYNLYSSIGYKFATLISPPAHVSRFATIGRFVKLNTNCNIMHDNVIGDFVTVSPNAVTLGYVNIADRVFLGANSTILPNLTVGEKATVGAGGVVTKNVKNGTVVKGVPAK